MSVSCRPLESYCNTHPSTPQYTIVWSSNPGAVDGTRGGHIHTKEADRTFCGPYVAIATCCCVTFVQLLKDYKIRRSYHRPAAMRMKRCKLWF